jgi:hypothetical protein
MTAHHRSFVLLFLCAGMIFFITSAGFGKSVYVSTLPNGIEFGCLNCHPASSFSLLKFASDYKGNSKTWTNALAIKDSDGDGRTNGAELLDPTGAWRPGQPDPGNSTEVTNPGVSNITPTPTLTRTRTSTPMPTPTSTSTLIPTPTPTLTPDPNADTDGDGVIDTVEQNGPHGGDANDDTIPDQLQPEVSSLPNAVDGRYVVLAAPQGTQLIGVIAQEVPGAPLPPVGISFPVGLIRFFLKGETAGFQAQVHLLLPEGVQPTAYWKLGSTLAVPPAPMWYPFSYDGTTGAQIVGNEIILNLKDGELGDNDLLANQLIDDPGGPVVPLVPSAVNYWGFFR